MIEDIPSFKIIPDLAVWVVLSGTKWVFRNIYKYFFTCSKLTRPKLTSGARQSMHAIYFSIDY